MGAGITQEMLETGADRTALVAGREMTAFERANSLVPDPRKAEKAILPAGNTTPERIGNAAWGALQDFSRDFLKIPGYLHDATTAHFSPSARKVQHDIIFGYKDLPSSIPKPMLPGPYAGKNTRTSRTLEKPWFLYILSDVKNYHLNSQTLVHCLGASANITEMFVASEKEENKRGWVAFSWMRANKAAKDVSQKVEDTLKGWRDQMITAMFSYVEHLHMVKEYKTLRQATMLWGGVDGPKESFGMDFLEGYYPRHLPELHWKISIGLAKMAAQVGFSAVGLFKPVAKK